MSILQVDNLSGLSGTDITIEIGKAIKGAASQFKITGGTAGQVIQTDGSGGLSFTTAGGLPAQTGNTGKYLTTDGSATSWANALPTKPDIITAEIIKNLKSIILVFPAPIKAKRRISFYQVKIMLPCGNGRKNSGACSLNLERG